MTELAMPSANSWFGIRLLPGLLSLVSAMAVQNALVQVSLHGVPATAVITTNIARFTTDVGNDSTGSST